MESHFFDHIAGTLFIAALVLVAFSKLRLPSILAYLIVGIIVGPDVLRFLSSEKETEVLSELGIILMMFMIGLDFAWPRLRKNIKAIAIAGSAAVASTAGVTMWVLMQYFGFHAPAAFLIGGAVAMSSSIVINKQLMEQKEFYDSHGRIAFSITIFQDFAVLVFLAAIPALANPDPAMVWRGLATAVGTAFAVLGGLYFVGQKIERPLMRTVGALKSSEIFLVVTLLVIIGAGWVSSFFNLPVTLGAFLAGMVVGETEFKHKIEDDIKPFRDIMLGIFYIMVGVSLKLSVILSHFLVILGILAAMMIVKMVLTALVVFAYQRNLGNSIRAGLILSSCDELSMMIVILSVKAGIIQQDLGNMLLVACVLSLVLSTFLILFNRAITFRILSLLGQDWRAEETPAEHDEREAMSDHIVLCGFGETGKNLFRMLDTTDVPILAMDTDPQRVEMASAMGCGSLYGDASNLKALKSAGIARARGIVLTFDNYAQSLKILQKVRSEYPSLPVVARVHRVTDIDDLMMLGATAVFADGFGTTQTMQQDIARALRIPEDVFGAVA